MEQDKEPTVSSLGEAQHGDQATLAASSLPVPVQEQGRGQGQEHDPFSILGQPGRTNSFPDVPAMSEHVAISQIRPLPSSEAEEVVEHSAQREEVADRERIVSLDFAGDRMSQESELLGQTLSADEEALEAEQGELEESLAGNIESQHDAEEARFEEGMPLVPGADQEASEEDHAEDVQSKPRAESTAFDDDLFGESAGPGADEEFYNDQSLEDTLSKAGPDQARWALERKSTEQVIGSLDANHNSQSEGGILEEQENHTPDPTGEPSSETVAEPVNDKAVEFDWMSQAAADGAEANFAESLAGVNGQDLSEMWKAVLDEDDFLEEDDTSGQDLSAQEQESAQQSQMQHQFRSASATSRYTPAGGVENSFPGSPAMHQQSNQQQANHPSQLSNASYFSAWPGATGGHVPSPTPQGLRPELSTAQSFADKAKGGYSSPYDLPMDVSRPRKKVSMQHMAQGHPNQTTGMLRQAPPRSSSVNVTQTTPTGDFAAYDQMHGSSGMPSPSLHPPNAPQSGASHVNSLKPMASVPSLKTEAKKSGFFEELPMNQKPRQASSGRYTPAPTTRNSPPPPPSGPAMKSFSAQQRSPPSSSGNSQYEPSNGLRQNTTLSGQMNLYAFSQPNNLAAPPPPPAQSRYSPAPQNNQAPVTAQAKYASPPKRTQSPNASLLTHQPRTSSPLAYHGPSEEQHSIHTTGSIGSQPTATEGNSSLDHDPTNRGACGQQNVAPALPISQIPLISEYAEEASRRGVSRDVPLETDNEPLQQAIPAQIQQEPASQQKPATQRYAPIQRQQPTTFQGANGPELAPRRSQTQSPSMTMKVPQPHIRQPDPVQRPASVNMTHRVVSPGATGQSSIPLSSLQGNSPGGALLSPTDGREKDPLERWKGCPIFSWGFGNSVITSFPKDSQRYNASQAHSMIKRTPGEVKLCRTRDFLPLDDLFAQFPGPLKGKGKKRDVLSWLGRKIELLEKLSIQAENEPSSESAVRRRLEDRVLLWKAVQVFVEHDGSLEGESVGKAARSFLSPASELPIRVEETSLKSNAVVDRATLEQLKQHLADGEREKAIWLAADKQLWAYAMLISSTLGQSVWKQVVQEFVRRDVRSVGDSQSLAALFEVFGGNWEESIDEIVPPSARAGLQLVSKGTDSTSLSNALEGLERWRETLSLIMNNRSSNDGQAIASLGRLLLSYGRVEAAHTCFVFARFVAQFGGEDDAMSAMTLLGSSHVRSISEPESFMDSILLSEIFEFGVTLSASSPNQASAPHLQAYKLHHAFVLAEYGHQAETQHYCDAILTTIKSSTKPSPYYNSVLMGSLHDLSKRIAQSPKDGSSSWIPRPSMEKVGGSFMAKFNSFVAGDDAGNAPGAPGGATSQEPGPFSRIAGGTPTISRSPSSADIYGMHGGSDGMLLSNQSHFPAPTSNSRYMPNTSSSTRSSLDRQRGTYEPSLIGDPGNMQGPEQVYANTQNVSNPSLVQNQYSDSYARQPTSIPETPSPYVPVSQTPFSEPVQSTINNATSSSQPAAAVSHPGLGLSEYAPSGVGAGGPYEPRQGFVPIEASDQPSQGGIGAPSLYTPLPPSTSSYEPPGISSYLPQPTDNDSAQGEPNGRPKKSFMDDEDDDGLMARAQSLKPDKSQKDQEAEKNFKRAAEADAKRAEQQGDKKGWFGGWFGNKKDAPPGQGPIRAKLGEESSFYYDPDLKKWVNKKGGDSQQAPTARPPPPRGPAPRSVSDSAPARSSPLAGSPDMPPPGPRYPGNPNSLAPPISRAGSTVSATSGFSMEPPGSNGDVSVPPSGAGSPFRPASPLTNGNEPSAKTMPQPPGFSSGGPPSRPPTSMSNVSSIDDLLGPPGSRKPGGSSTSKKGKKGRYVDVMAK